MSHYCLFPVKDTVAWRFYQQQKHSLWTVDEITQLDADKTEFGDDSKFSQGLREFLLTVLAFFACSDAIVNEKLFDYIIGHRRWSQAAKMYYAAQMFIETIHNETYNVLIDTLCSATPELESKKDRYFDGITNFPSIQRKAEWFDRMTEEYKDNIGALLVVQACVEGIHFSSSFACVFYLKTLNLLPGVVVANQFIVRDEGLHRDFAIHQHNSLPPYEDGVKNTQLPMEHIKNIIREAVDLEVDFVRESLQVSVMGLSAENMITYVQHVANHLILSIGGDPIYEVTNPFPWMEAISLENKTNFFEHNTSEYAVLTTDTNESMIEEDF